MGKSILDFTSINGRSGTEFTQVKGRSGTIFWCKPYTLTLSSKPTGVDTITCYRYSSQQPGVSTGTSAVLANGDTIYYGDVIYIAATASSGYYDPTVSSSTGTISNHLLEVDGNETITVTAGALATAACYVSAGTGVSSVFLSDSSSATTGSPSGTAFNIGSTVYAYATLSTGYNPDSGWTLISGSTYRIGSKTVNVDTTQNDFGTANGSLKSFTITFALGGSNYGSWGSATKTAYYGDKITRSGNTVTCYIGSTSTARWTNTFTNGSATGYTYSVSYNSITSPVTGIQTITATTSRSLNSYTITFTGTYCTWGSSTKTAYYGDTLSLVTTKVLWWNYVTGIKCTTSSGTERWTNNVTKNSDTAQYTYSNITESNVSNGTGTITGARTVTATSSRSVQTYTVTFSNPQYGSWTRSSITGVPYGTRVSVSGFTVTINGYSSTLSGNSTNNTTSYYCYASQAGISDGATITGSTTVTGVCGSAPKTYAVLIEWTAGAGQYGDSLGRRAKDVSGYNRPYTTYMYSYRKSDGTNLRWESIPWQSDYRYMSPPANTAFYFQIQDGNGNVIYTSKTFEVGTFEDGSVTIYSNSNVDLR